jgi:hypothetical protein
MEAAAKFEKPETRGRSQTPIIRKEERDIRTTIVAVRRGIVFV